MNENASTKTILATLVPDEKRMDFLPSVFGRYFLKGERLIYSWMDKLCSGYSGGYWKFYSLNQGKGFFLAPDVSATLSLVVESNYFSGEMSAEAAGIVACLFALNYLSCEDGIDEDTQDMLVEEFYCLRAFAIEHDEAELILKAID